MLTTILMTAFASDPWVGTYSQDDYHLRFEDEKGKRIVRLLRGTEVLAYGPLTGDGTLREAPLDGCGGTFSIEAGDIMLDLDGPECPYEMNGLYQRAKASACPSGGKEVLACAVEQKGQRKQLSICTAKGDSFAYRYGPAGSPELAIDGGRYEERALASGLELGWSFDNDGYLYRAFVVQSSREADNAAGVVVSKGGKDLATLTCVDGWTYRP